MVEKKSIANKFRFNRSIIPSTKILK